MASEKAAIAENVQKYLGKSDWKSAIAEMEKLFAIDQDPIIRVRIGDARQKMNQKAEAVKEYIHAADLYAEKGFVVKALAQYKLALRLDPANKDAQGRIELLHTNKSVSELKLEPIEDGALEPTRSVIPLFSDFTQEEFNEFTKRMIIHTMPPGKAIIKEGDTGRSVFILTRGSVKVVATVMGKKVELAALQASDFFGEIAFLTGKPRTATVETTEESDVLEVAEEDLNEMIVKSPRIREVLHNYHEQRVKSTLEKVKDSL
ncbi:MAG: cyclic nucleotide-binding domain-containing protein [Nitrospiraceae bacterium]|nr:cyclic nucleotide-binding domain-containing protein [Nitrospiraceae bacterium]